MASTEIKLKQCGVIVPIGIYNDRVLKNMSIINK